MPTGTPWLSTDDRGRKARSSSGQGPLGLADHGDGGQDGSQHLLGVSDLRPLKRRGTADDRRRGEGDDGRLGA
jgi:hypothetical protein